MWNEVLSFLTLALALALMFCRTRTLKVSLISDERLNVTSPNPRCEVTGGTGEFWPS